MPVKHGVKIVYGKTVFPLSARDLQLTADALEIINPDEDEVERRARCLSAAFLALSEYAESVKRPFVPDPADDGPEVEAIRNVRRAG